MREAKLKEQEMAFGRRDTSCKKTILCVIVAFLAVVVMIAVVMAARNLVLAACKKISSHLLTLSCDGK